MQPEPSINSKVILEIIAKAVQTYVKFKAAKIIE
jgi:hypothetical protein